MMGLPVQFSAHALEKTKERLFPESKYRSKRILKKLIKRHGGEFKMKPCIWQFNGRIVAHPIYRAEFERLARQ